MNLDEYRHWLNLRADITMQKASQWAKDGHFYAALKDDMRHEAFAKASQKLAEVEPDKATCLHACDTPIMHEVGAVMERDEDNGSALKLWVLVSQLGHIADADDGSALRRAELIELAATALRWAEKIKERQ